MSFQICRCQQWKKNHRWLFQSYTNGKK
jgi:hypothetical protein